jgi:quinol monooxygenase YgiN
MKNTTLFTYLSPLSIVRNKSTMTTISTDNNFLTLINVFTVDPSNQQKLVDLLILATEGSVSKVAGFISSSLHKSIDGTKVTMYAQWRSMEDYQKMRNNPIASPYLQQALAIAKFEPGMYEVVKTFLPVT